MKKFLYNIVVTVAFLSLFTLCEKEDDEPVVIETNLVIDKTSFTVSASSAAEVFNVTSNKDWTAKNDAAWITLSPASGKADSKIQVSLTIAENDDTADRTTTITVTAEDKTGEVTVKQIGKEIIIIPGIEIADAQFKKYLLENFDSNRDGVISDEEALTVTKIDCSSQEIATLKGIANFVNLDTLICANNKLDSIDISGNKKLKHLDCSTNALTDIVLSLNEDLKSLNCSNNKLDSLIIAGNQALVSLNCSKNSLKSLDISNNAALDTLICTGNPELESIYFAKDQQVSHLEYDSETTTLVYPEPEKVYVNIPDPKFKEYLIANFDTDKDGEISTDEATEVKEILCYNQQISSLEGIEAFVNLEKIICSKNNFTTLDFSKNAKLKDLNCSSNGNLRSINLSGCVALQILSAINCNLTSLEISNNQELIDVNCGYNSLSILDVSQNVKLEKFVCRNNSLKTLDLHRNIMLKALNTLENPQLSEIYLEEGQTIPSLYIDAHTKFIYPNYITIEDDVFRSYILELYDDDDNGRLSESEMSYITEIKCIGMGIKSLKGIESFKYLTLLECSGNEIESLDLSKNTALTVLRCDSNKLQKLDVSQNLALTELSCGKNQLTSLSLAYNTNLKYLACNDNTLYALELEKNTKIETILCQGNQIGYFLYLQYNLALNTLDCTNNPRLKFVHFRKGYTPANLLYDSNVTGIKYLADEDIEKMAPVADPIFKQFLIDAGFDTDKDGEFTKTEMQKVTKIDCSNLGISTLSGIEYCTELTSLVCSNNKLTSLDLTGNTKLIELNCYMNDLSNLDITRCTNLRTLRCGANKLTALNLAKNTRLTFLDCTNNKLTVLNIKPNLSLTDVRCTGNSGLTVYIFSCASSSIVHGDSDVNIDCATNVNGLNFTDLAFEFYLVENFDTNHDGGIDATEAAAITTVECRGLGIKSLGGVTQLPNLKILNCSDNELSGTFDVGGTLPNLINLVVSGNNLTAVNLTQFPNLQWFMCDENKITGSLDVYHCPNLDYLDCSDNQIGTILDLRRNTKLTYVRCDYNKFLGEVWLLKDVMNESIIQYKDANLQVVYKDYP